MRPLLRAVIAFAAALCVWLVASPAKAAAPLCDARGATMLAPPPQLQAPSAAIDAASANEVCVELDAQGDAIEQGRGHTPLPTWSMDATSAGSSAPSSVEPASPSGTLDDRQESAPPTGVRARVDRPPRA